MSWLKFTVDWGSTVIGFASSNPYVSTAVAIVQAGIQFSVGNYLGGVICLMGAIPIPYANKVTKILGDYAGKLIALGTGPKIVIQFIAKILGNCTRGLKAFVAIKILIELFLKYKAGKISWSDLEVVVKYMFKSKGGAIPDSVAATGIEINVIEG